MTKMQVSIEDCDTSGYSLAVLTKEDGTNFAAEELNGLVGKLIQKFVTQLESISYLPVDTREMKSLPGKESIRRQVGDVRRAVVEIVTDLTPPELPRIEIQIPTYLQETANFRRKLDEYITELNEAA